MGVSEVEVGLLVTVAFFSGTGGGASVSGGRGREAGSLPSSGSGTAFAGVVSCVGVVSTSFEIEVDLSPEASGATLPMAWVALIASCAGCLLVVESAG